LFSPVFTVDIVINAGYFALFAGHRTVHQHPGRILLALVCLRPGGTVFVLVSTVRLDPWFRCGCGWFSDNRSTTSGLGVPGALVESVEFLDVYV